MNNNTNLAEVIEGELQKSKILIIGNGSVGKSAINTRYLKGEFESKSMMTAGIPKNVFLQIIGNDYQQKDVVVNKINVKLQIWDTAGQEIYRPMVKSYFKGAKGVFLVFDLMDSQSFADMNYWLKELNRGIDEQYVKLLIGNKLDLKEAYEQEHDKDNDNCPVNDESIKQFAKENDIQLLYTSARTGHNIEQAFTKMAEMLIEQFKDQIQMKNLIPKSETQEVNGSIKLTHKKDEKIEKKGMCTQGCC